MKKICTMLVLLCLLVGIASAASAHECRFGPWKTKRKATCTQTGLDFRYCRDCDHWEKREVSKLPHTVETWEITLEPSCTKKGTKTAYCTVCGTRVRHFIDMLEHEYGEMTVTREPDCTQNGRGEYTCAGCGRVKAESIAKLGHDWTLVSTDREPTCKATGKGTLSCSRCGRTQTSTLDKLEHQWGEWTVTAEPSGAKKGTREHTCALCGESAVERFFWEGTLYQDMEPCEEVIRLQEMLRDLGYYSGNIRSGTFGQLTGKAVYNFQKKNGLRATEVADPETIEAITAAWEKRFGGQ